MSQPLTESIGSVDLSYPRLQPSNYEVGIENAERIPNKAGTGFNLRLNFKTVADGTSTHGDVVPSGVKLTMYIGLTESDRRPLGAIKKDVARLGRAARLPVETTIQQIMDNPEMLVGRTLIAKVGIRQATAEFPESNEVKGIVLEG
jgi:hypothetical protein